MAACTNGGACTAYSRRVDITCTALAFRPRLRRAGTAQEEIDELLLDCWLTKAPAKLHRLVSWLPTLNLDLRREGDELSISDAHSLSMRYEVVDSPRQVLAAVTHCFRCACMHVAAIRAVVVIRAVIGHTLAVTDTAVVI